MFVDYNGKTLRLPDFLIVGAAKCGTTSLHYYLKQHPSIFLPVKKELYYFSYMDAPQNEIPRWLIEEHSMPLTLGEYADCFRDAPKDQVIGEACTLYLYMHEKTIAHIKKVYGDRFRDIKIIIVLRNPVERAWSQYAMHVRNGDERIKDFRKAIEPALVRNRLDDRWDAGYDYVGRGMYYDQVSAWMKEFRHVKIFLYEELTSRPEALVKDIFRFTGVNDAFVPNMKTRYNVSGNSSSKVLDYLIAKKNPFKSVLKKVLPFEMRRKLKFSILNKLLKKPEMPYDVRKELLEKYYRSDIVKLQALIHKDLSKWLELP